MKFEGKLLRKHMMQMKGKEVGYVDVKVLWAMDKQYIGQTLNIKVDVFTIGAEDLKENENYLIETTYLGTILKVVSFYKMTPFAKVE